MLLVLLVGGFIVSAKIGGGSNLHNLDGYLTLSLSVGLYLLFDRFTPEASPAPVPADVFPTAGDPDRTRGDGVYRLTGNSRASLA